MTLGRLRVRVSVMVALGSVVASLAITTGSAAATPKRPDAKPPGEVLTKIPCTLSVFSINRSAGTAVYFYLPPDNWARTFWVNGQAYELGPKETITAPLPADGTVLYPDATSKVRFADLEACASRSAGAFSTSRASARQSTGSSNGDSDCASEDDDECGPFPIPGEGGGCPPEFPIFISYADRCAADDDEDGVSDEDEGENGTDPGDDDSDDDGSRDGAERLIGTDARVASIPSNQPFFMRRN